MALESLPHFDAYVLNKRPLTKLRVYLHNVFTKCASKVNLVDSVRTAQQTGRHESLPRAAVA